MFSQLLGIIDQQIRNNKLSEKELDQVRDFIIRFIFIYDGYEIKYQIEQRLIRENRKDKK